MRSCVFRWLLVFGIVDHLPAALHAGATNSLMDLSPDGKFLAVTNSDNASVTIVDTAARKALREITVGQKPQGVTWIGNTSRIAVTIYDERSVAFVDVDRGKVVKRLRTEAEPYGIVADRA